MEQLKCPGLVLGDSSQREGRVRKTLSGIELLFVCGKRGN
jgi:hypothetical protein